MKIEVVFDLPPQSRPNAKLVVPAGISNSGRLEPGENRQKSIYSSNSQPPSFY
ncbi:MAG: hypothetical protein ABW170_11785 [Candidatus Thiodiazotropha sp. L084R]